MKKRAFFVVLFLIFALCASVGIAAAAQTEYLTVNLPCGGDVSIYVNGEYCSLAPVYKMPIEKDSVVTLKAKSEELLFYSDEYGNTLGNGDNYEFSIFNDTVVNAYCVNSNPERVSILYRNTNNSKQVLSLSTFERADIEANLTQHIQISADKFGYEFSSWSMSLEDVIAAAKTNGGTVIIEPEYTMRDDVFVIKVDGGYISSDNENDGVFQINTSITLQADEAPTGKKFAYWTNSLGTVVSDTETLSLTVFANEEYTAHFVDESETPELLPNVYLRAEYDEEIGKIVTYAQRFLPAGCVLDAYGILYVKDSEYAVEDMLFELVDNVTLKMTYNGDPKTNNGVWVNRVTCEQYVYLRPYIIYVDADGASHTVYGDAVKALPEVEKINTVVYDERIVPFDTAKAFADELSTALGMEIETVEAAKATDSSYIYISEITPYAEKYGWRVDDGVITLYYGAFAGFKTLSQAFITEISALGSLDDVSSTELSVNPSSTVSTASKFSAKTQTAATLDLYLEDRANLVLASENTDVSGISGKIYYISEKGSDSNDGLSKETPWKTLSKLSGAKLKSGDAVLFERGGLYRGTIAASAGVTYGCYGEGNKPIICGSARNYAGMWSRVEGDENIWKLNLKGLVDPGIMIFYENESELYRVGFDYDVITGQRVFDYRTMYTTYENAANSSTIHGYLTLNKNFEFYYGEPDLDEDTFNANTTTYTLYVYYDGDLNADFENIEIGEDKSLFRAQGVDNVTVDGLCFKHTGAHSVRGGQNRTNGLTVKNCVFAYSGGSVLQNRWVRYGNAIEIYGSGTDIEIYNNWMYQIYDTAFTMQYSGSTIKEDLIWKDVSVHDNVMERCYWGMELWCHPASGYTMTASNINISGNVISKIGNFWGAYQHQSATGGCMIYLGDMNIPDAELETRPVTFENNIFDRTYIEGYVPSADKIHNYTKMFKFHHDNTSLSSYHKFYEFKDNYFIQYSKQLFALYNGDEGGNTYFNAVSGEKYNTAAEKKWSDFFKLFSTDDMSGSKVCVITE